MLLAALLCRPNTVTPLDRLLDLIWEGHQPPTARKNLHVYASGLRKIVGNRVACVAQGYLIQVRAEELDLLRFENLVAAGRTARRGGDLEGSRLLLSDAVRLWRDRALVDLLGNSFIAAESDRLADRYLDAYEDWVDLEIWAGHHLDVLGELTRLVAEHPFRERLVVAAMTSLDQGGSRREALACYEAHRQFMARELGLDPSPVLQDLYRSILAAGSGTGLIPAAPGASVGVARDSVKPAQLPRDLHDFVGRQAQIAELTAAVRGDANDVAIITGLPGAGKTALATRVGHLLADQFPDGQVFVSLCDHQGKAMPWQRVLAGLMRSTGLRTTAQADDAVALALWRSWVAEHRFLLVFDDAISEACVRWLLPGSGTSRTLVTSTRLLSGLESVFRIEIGDLSPPEAAELLQRILGPVRTRGGQDAIGRILLRCGGLPQTIRTIATKLAMLRHLSLAEYAEQLECAADVLDELAVGDMSLCSRLLRFHDGLSPRQQEAFHALGALPSPRCCHEDIVTALAGLQVPADRMLEELMEACLVAVSRHEVMTRSPHYEIPVSAHHFAASRHLGAARRWLADRGQSVP